MPRRRSVLDPRLYGIAPVESEAHGGRPYLTLAGVLNRLQIGEDTFRRHHGALLRQRIMLSPQCYRWRLEDVDRYMTELQAAQRAKEDALQATYARKIERRVARRAQSAVEVREILDAKDAAAREKLQAYYAEGS